MQKVDFIIIGAGIIGLATAYQILKKNKKTSVIVLEKEKDIGVHQTSRNSGVIHSGLYYKPGSLKAINCIQGRKELIEFCQEFNIPNKKCGKIIVATKDSELSKLYDLEKRGNQNRIDGLEILDIARIKEIEPHIKAIKGLHVPNCHIVDYYEVAKELKNQIEKLGGKVLLNEKVIDIKKEDELFSIITPNNTLLSKNLINCAGLHSDRIAKLASPNQKISVKIIPFRGEYYKIKEAKADLVKALVYPVTDPKFPFLGVHLTRMMNGNVEIGPNAVFAFSREGYKKIDVNIKDFIDSILYRGFLKVALKYWKVGFYETYRSFSKRAFLNSAKKMLPDIKKEDFLQGNAGVRAQAIDKKGNLLDDFAIIKENRAIHVLNAPSPAATACLSIGKYIANLAQEISI